VRKGGDFEGVSSRRLSRPLGEPLLPVWVSPRRNVGAPHLVPATVYPIGLSLNNRLQTHSSLEPHGASTPSNSARCRWITPASRSRAPPSASTSTPATVSQSTTAYWHPATTTTRNAPGRTCRRRA